MGWPKKREQIGVGRTVKGSQDRRSANFIRMRRKREWRVELRRAVSETWENRYFLSNKSAAEFGHG